MAATDFITSYTQHVARLRADLPEAEAFEAAVGGEFLTIGKLERALLRSLGLADGQRVIDVGCGSGRLALQLSGLATLRYLGTDVVEDLLSYAQRLCGRRDWSFIRTDGQAIPCSNGVADFVCFFSVFTHLTHEATFRYLQEAKRVLKPGGRVVFSFLEFQIESHWNVFAHSLENSPRYPLNQFIERAAIETWTKRLNFEIDAIHDGDKPHIPLEDDLAWSDGRIMQGFGNLGQSVAVLCKP